LLFIYKFQTRIVRVTIFYLPKRKLEKHEEIYLEFHSLFSNFGINFRNYIRSHLSKVTAGKKRSIDWLHTI